MRDASSATDKGDKAMPKEKQVTYIGKVTYVRSDSQYPDFDIEVKSSMHGKMVQKVVLATQDNKQVCKSCSVGDYVHVVGTESDDTITPQFCEIVNK